jgi:dTDP-4-amino-4,6-dideoxygalactose transaminase
MVLQAAPGLRVARHRQAIDAAVSRVFARGQFILGPEGEAFEAEFARYLGAEFAIGVNSGTDAIAVALAALGIGAGDEVIVPALTHAGTAMGVQLTGASHRIVDIEPLTRGMDPSALADAISPRTAAIVVVHLHGTPALLPDILRIASAHRLAVVEDCAQAQGAMLDGRMLGTWGDAAAFSFYPTKNLGALGDAGAVVVRTRAHAERARRLRNYGQDASGLSEHEGMNSRLDEIQAAILRTLLPHLDGDNAARRSHAQIYDAALASVAAEGRVKTPAPHPGSVYHQYAIEVDERERVRDALARRGIGTGIHYAHGLHRHPNFAAGATCPVADRLADTLLSLPIQPELMEHQPRIISALLAALAAESGR